jgi:hypothetical protein
MEQGGEYGNKQVSLGMDERYRNALLGAQAYRFTRLQQSSKEALAIRNREE